MAKIDLSSYSLSDLKIMKDELDRLSRKFQDSRSNWGGQNFTQEDIDNMSALDSKNSNIRPIIDAEYNARLEAAGINIF